MSSTKLPAINLAPDDMRMDDRSGRESPYYCLPPMHFDASKPAPPRRQGGYPYHLVSQGHKVGLFNSWAEAKASVSSFADANHQGFYTIDEAVDVWQRLCVLGVHPHPVEPAVAVIPSASASTFVNTSPRKGGSRHGSPVKVKREDSSPPSPSKNRAGAVPLNFAIRGGGIVSSSAARAEQRYRQAQLRGEEPDMLVTRNVREASYFAAEDGSDDDDQY